MNPELAIVIPIFNEAATLPELYRRLTAAPATVQLSSEIVFVDDGSDGKSVRKLVEASGTLRLVTFGYFDSVGILLSLGNRWITRQPRPSAAAIRFWNEAVLPVSRRVDRFFAHRVGKSFVAVATTLRGGRQ